jgi:peptide chain release factor subunit 1
VRKYLQIGAVDTVLISEEVQSFRTAISCTNCDYTGNKTVRSLKVCEGAVSSEACPKCGESSLGIDEFKSTLDEFQELAETTGAKVEIISIETEEGQQFMAFGGIAAILRFRP